MDLLTNAIPIASRGAGQVSLLADAPLAESPIAGQSEGAAPTLPRPRTPATPLSSNYPVI